MATDNSYFSLPETGKGLIPGAGGTQRLTASAGKYIVRALREPGAISVWNQSHSHTYPVSQAMKTILLGKPLTAVEAMGCGLVAEVVPEHELLSASVDMAKIIVNRSSQAIQFAKQAINRGKNSTKFFFCWADASTLELLTFNP